MYRSDDRLGVLWKLKTPTRLKIGKMKGRYVDRRCRKAGDFPTKKPWDFSALQRQCR